MESVTGVIDTTELFSDIEDDCGILSASSALIVGLVVVVEEIIASVASVAAAVVAAVTLVSSVSAVVEVVVAIAALTGDVVGSLVIKNH